jgi:hypothetical protein
MQQDGTPLWAGTGFFVKVEEDRVEHVHLVTARHVVERVRGAALPLFARVNESLTPGAPVAPAIKLDLLMPELLPTIRTSVIPTRAFLTDAIRAKRDIGIGDEVMAVGLYVPVPGTARSYPIVRAGIIAAMNNEPIYDGFSRERYDAYLVELHSTGGLSGSPVWVADTGFGRHADGAINLQGQHYVLGIVRDGWDYEGPSVPGGRKTEINMGITAVTPITPLLDVLNRHTLRKRVGRPGRSVCSWTMCDFGKAPIRFKQGPGSDRNTRAWSARPLAFPHHFGRFLRGSVMTPIVLDQSRDYFRHDSFPSV